MTSNRPRRFNKFVALDERGNPLWATMENTPEEAKERFDRFNPDPTGQGHDETIWRVQMILQPIED